MIVDLEQKETESGWFDLKGGGRVHVRLLSDEDRAEVRKLCRSTAVEYPLLGGQYRRFDVTKWDADLWEAELADRCILEWELIFDRSEKPVPVTRENKILLMGVQKFREAVDTAIETLTARAKEKAEALEKNSTSGSGG